MNLKWGTFEENMADRERHRLLREHAKPRRSQADHADVRRRYLAGESRRSIATATGIPYQTVSRWCSAIEAEQAS